MPPTALQLRTHDLPNYSKLESRYGLDFITISNCYRQPLNCESLSDYGEQAVAHWHVRPNSLTHTVCLHGFYNSAVRSKKRDIAFTGYQPASMSSDDGPNPSVHPIVWGRRLEP